MSPKTLLSSSQRLQWLLRSLQSSKFRQQHCAKNLRAGNSALRLISAISSPAAMRQLNDSTGMTLPDAEADYRSQPGPKQTLSLCERQVECFVLTNMLLKNSHQLAICLGGKDVVMIERI